jgi:hypothetical protein
MRRILLVAVISVIAACGTAEPPSVEPHNDCALVVQPGPNPPARQDGDAIDGADFGVGRWRLCLAEPIAGAAEASAWCEWTPDRTAVVGFSGLSVTIDGISLDSGLSIATNEVFLAGYAPGPVAPSVEATDDGRSGRVGFGMVPRIDPEHGAEPGLAPRVIGVMTWQCGDPPPPR